MSEILLHYTRAGHVENIHRGDAVAVNCKGEIVSSIGNAQLPMFWRSAAKPFQALPFVKNGGLERYGITDEELALLVSSHSGEENHVALVRGILSKLGLDESVLDCGVVRPMSGKAFKKIIEAGEKVLPVHNACSGKHSQIIALAMMLGVPIEGYTKPDHEAQRIIFKHVAMASKMPEDKLEIGIDGCGVPVFYLPIYNMSLAYARLSTPSKGDWGEYTDAATKIRDAMSKYPQVVSGTGRIDLAINEITGGRIIATGGGAVLREENVDALKQNGLLVFLDRPLEELLPTGDRPLADDREKLQRLYTVRYSIYTRTADLVLPVRGTPEETANALLEMLL